ncbi:MAG: hypothetical protein VX208_11260 [SAR324 cluster bacterium]|nr:hypothetical protein [SAR324 cluster bacterium]
MTSNSVNLDNTIFQIYRYCTLLVLCLLFASGCTTKHWKNQGDSCVFTASEPPLRRVVNYRDHDLCNRKLPARTPPFPRVRSNPEMQD